MSEQVEENSKELTPVELGNDSEMLDGSRASETTVESAMALVMAGASFDEIAKRFEFRSGRHVKRVVERALASTVTLTEKTHLRAVASRRYEMLFKSVIGRATNPREAGQLAYNQRAQAILDRIVKLHGLEAPTQVQISPSDDYLAAYANKMAQTLGLDTNIESEPDILEGEFLDEDYYEQPKEA